MDACQTATHLEALQGTSAEDPSESIERPAEFGVALDQTLPHGDTKLNGIHQMNWEIVRNESTSSKNDCSTQAVTGIVMDC